MGNGEVQRFEIQGLKELYDKLQTLDVDMQKKIARRAASAGARIVRDAARVNALDSVDTGNMKAAIVMKRSTKSQLSSLYNIAVRVGKTQDTKAGKAEGRRAKRAGEKPDAKVLGRDAWYAKFIEYEYGGVKAPPKPFMGPALQNNITKVTQVMKEKIETDLKEIWDK